MGCHSVKIMSVFQCGKDVVFHYATSPWVLKNNFNKRNSVIDKGRTEGCQSKKKVNYITVARPSCAQLYKASPGTQKE